MATSSILGATPAAAPAAGRDSKALGPSDSSDSGSDVTGVPEAADTDREATGERSSVEGPDEGLSAPDIEPDRIIDAGPGAGLDDEPPEPDEGADVNR